MLIGLLKTNVSEIWTEIPIIIIQENMSEIVVCAKWSTFCHGVNELTSLIHVFDRNARMIEMQCDL